jgi:LPXTG-site transpeptidase (sortase) family protein
MPDTPATRTTSHTSEQLAVNENEIAATAEPSDTRQAENTPDTEQVDVAPRASAEPELPVRIEIDALNRTVPVRNPTSRRVSDLDRALLSGVVRHPDSAHFDQTGTMFVLGHSSRLPNVVNENFQAFNDIEDLTWGDTIRVYSTDTMYVYRVEDVYEAKATVASVPIAGDTQTLTLATCNSFGTKDDRFIVEALLVREQEL